MADKTISSPFQQEVWNRLDNVMDPELDEPVTDMGFIEEVLIDGENVVEVAFRLPTYWCSPNFAFLMAQGIKQQVEMLPWVARVNVRLEDHLSADDICAAVNEDRNIDDVFRQFVNTDLFIVTDIKDLAHSIVVCSSTQDAINSICYESIGSGLETISIDYRWRFLHDSRDE